MTPKVEQLYLAAQPQLVEAFLLRQLLQRRVDIHLLVGLQLTVEVQSHLHISTAKLLISQCMRFGQQ